MEFEDLERPLFGDVTEDLVRADAWCEPKGFLIGRPGRTSPSSTLPPLACWWSRSSKTNRRTTGSRIRRCFSTGIRWNCC